MHPVQSGGSQSRCAFVRNRRGEWVSLVDALLFFCCYETAALEWTSALVEICHRCERHEGIDDSSLFAGNVVTLPRQIAVIMLQKAVGPKPLQFKRTLSAECYCSLSTKTPELNRLKNQHYSSIKVPPVLGGARFYLRFNDASFTSDEICLI